MEIAKFQNLPHLFEIQCPKVYGDEIRSFYDGLIMEDGDTLCQKINGKDFILDKDILGEILNVPIDRMKRVESPDFKKLIIKKKSILSG